MQIIKTMKILRINLIQFLETKLIASCNNNFQLCSKTRQFQGSTLIETKSGK